MDTSRYTIGRLPILKITVRLLIALYIIGVAATGLHAQEGQLAAMRGTVKDSYNFWLYAPREYVAEHQRVPVIVFLHGASLCGKNLQRVRRYGLLHAIEKGRYYPAMVVAPQNPGGAWNPHKIARILDWVEQHHKVDTSRVYVIGMSLGGYGTLDFAGTYPDRCAAAMALCGGSTLKDVSGLGQVPLWIMHGTADRAVPVSASQKVVRAMQQSGNDKLLRYDWLKGASHGDLARILYLKQTYDWLFSHSLNDTPRTLDSDIPITLQDMKEAYEYLSPEETRFREVREIQTVD
ncbi:MAG: alpha/beta hydrolase-fold protein [Clostridium sp.]|nr:alpha/beta hydrolase-fold protein [Clostridium sp.]